MHYDRTLNSWVFTAMPFAEEGRIVQGLALASQVKSLLNSGNLQAYLHTEMCTCAREDASSAVQLLHHNGVVRIWMPQLLIAFNCLSLSSMLSVIASDAAQCQFSCSYSVKGGTKMNA